MAKIAPDDLALEERLRDRAPKIREMVRSHPPNRLYRMVSSGHRVFITDYAANGLCCVAVTGKYNLVEMERNVFGVPLDDLVECDLPDQDEPLGVLLEPQEVHAALAKGRTRDERMAAVHHAAEEKRRRLTKGPKA